MIKLLSHTRCETFYEVDGVKLRLWAITGGTLAVDFADFGFTERYNYCEAFDAKKHPDWETTWEGPRIEHLEGGATTLIDFVRRNLPKKELRETRKNILNEKFGYELRSRRYHDLDNRAYFRAKVDLTSARVAGVSVESAYYWGQPDTIQFKYMAQEWIELHEWVKNLRGEQWKIHTLDELSEEQFEKYIELLEKAKGK